MKKNRLLENLNQEIGANIPMRRYSLADMISESYKAIYDCEDGSNLKRLAESHLADVKQNPRDIERLSRQLCILKEMKHLVEANELKDEDLVDKKKYDTVAPNKDRVIVQNECNESADMNASSNREILYTLNSKGGMAAEHIQSLINHYQPNSETLDDLSDDTVNKIIGYLKQKYSREIEKYGEDAEIPFEAYELLGLTESKKMRESRAPRRSRRCRPIKESVKINESVLKEADDLELTNEELDELAKHLKTIRKDKKMTEKANPDMPKRRGIKCHIADSQDPNKELNEESVPSASDFLTHHDNPSNYRSNPKGFDKAYEILDKYGNSDEDVDKVYDRMSDEDKIKAYNYISGKSSMSESKKSRGKRIKESKSKSLNESMNFEWVPKAYMSPAHFEVEIGDYWFCVYPPSPNTEYDNYGVEALDKVDYDLQDNDDVATMDDAIAWIEKWSSTHKSSANESKSYRGLQNFKKQSEGKAFYKTFKKMNDTLKEGKALTRQESIDLYKAANSALTQMSIELEHNPKFLKTFNESSTLLSTDVNSLRESLARGKAPSKKTMKSLAKFSEALLYEGLDSLEAVVMDSYNHFVNDLGRTPSVDDVLGDMERNYDIEKFGYSDNDPMQGAKFYKEVKRILRNNGAELEYVEESKKVNEADEEDLHNDGNYTVYRDAEGNLKCRDRNTGDDVEFDMKELIANGRVKVNEAEDEDEDLDDIEEPVEDTEEETPEEDFVGDDEGDVQSEEADAFDQEYADARVALHKDLVAAHADDEDPGVQERIAQDAEEVINLPGTTEEQIAEINGEESPEEPEGDDIEDEPVEDEADEDDGEITDDELEELKKHLKEMRSARK